MISGEWVGGGWVDELPWRPAHQGSSLASGDGTLTSSKKAVFVSCVLTVYLTLLCRRRLGTSSFYLIRSPTGQSLDFSRKKDWLWLGGNACGLWRGSLSPLFPPIIFLALSLPPAPMMCFFVDYSGKISKKRKGNMRLVLPCEL